MLEYWLWLSGRRGLGVRGLRALLEQFGTPEAVYCASDAEYPSDIRPDGRTSLADKELTRRRCARRGALRLPIRSLRLRGRSCSSATGSASIS